VDEGKGKGSVYSPQLGMASQFTATYFLILGTRGECNPPVPTE